jgi:hypothetical protein
MRCRILIALLLAAGIPLPGQGAPATAAPSTALPTLPNDPRAFLAAAAPRYDFNDPTLKPWHLKVSYQLYGEDGKPTEQGTFKYWWASPTDYRSTWTRPSATHTDWHTADGKHLYHLSGETLNFFEFKLQAALLSPLPGPADLDPAKVRLDRREQKLGGPEKYPCVMVIPLMPQHWQIQEVPHGLFPTYCFAPDQPALVASYSFGTLAMGFAHIARTQGRYLPMETAFYED